MQAKAFLNNGICKDEKSQILKEIEYTMRLYDLHPAVYIAYDREAFIDENDETFRMTIDRNIRSRVDNVRLEKGDYGINLLNKGEYIMEIKANGAIPLWFVKILSELKIYPTSFSKYGEIYKNNMQQQYAVAI